MTTITTVASIIGLVAFPLASVYDYYGPRPLFIVAMITYPVGSILFALSFMNVLCGSVFRFTIYCSLQGIGTSMFDISSLMTVMSIFPSSRGAVIAVMKTFIGLGAAIFGICQIGLFKNNIGLFFCTISAYVAIVGFLCSIFVTLPPYHLTGYE